MHTSSFSQQPFRRVAGWCLFASLVINLFCNSFSPFFIPEGAMDPNCFYAEGCAIAHGMLPYRDFLDVKGPLLFLIYTIGYLLTPTRCEGIFLLYVLATCGTLIAFYRTTELFHLTPKQSIVAVALTACALFSRAVTFWAAQPEQLMVFPFAWSLYYLTAFLTQPDAAHHRPLAWWVSIGAATSFLIKYNFVLPYTAIFCVVVFRLIHQGQAKEILPFFLRCLVGAGLICAPFIIYLTYHGLWNDFYHAYFQLNLEAAANQPGFKSAEQIKSKFISIPIKTLAYALLGHACAVGFICKHSEYRSLMRHLLPVLLVTFLSCFMGLWGYYYIIMAPTAIFCSIDIARHPFTNAHLERGFAWKLAAAALLLVFLINDHCLGPLGWGRPRQERAHIEAVQTMIARIPSPRIIYCESPDILLGRKAETLPGASMWMLLSGVYSCRESLRDCAIRERRADFIVTSVITGEKMKKLVQESGYTPISGAHFDRIGKLMDVQLWALPDVVTLLRPTN
ncbi:MAG: glycosyltransferase family 39 protein [Akkermansia sp.]|nr:glycosyltransferase family 39 protein [Akkermansia sp.]